MPHRPVLAASSSAHLPVDAEARAMYDAALRGDPPSLPTWALPGQPSHALPGIWQEPPQEPTTSSTSTTTTLVLFVGVEVQSETPLSEDDLYNFTQLWWVTSTTSTTSTSSSSATVTPADVVRDTVNRMAVLASHGDRVQLLQRLLMRQRYLHHELRLLTEAMDELSWWGGPPVTSVSFNAAAMERRVWHSIGREAQFGSSQSSSSTSRFLSTPTFLLQPGLPQTLGEVWRQFPQTASATTISGYRRRVWRSHMRLLHEREGVPLPLGSSELVGGEGDEDLFLIQRDERAALGPLPDGENVPGLRRLDRSGRYGRRRDWQPRPPPLLRDRAHLGRGGREEREGVVTTSGVPTVLSSAPALPSASGLLRGRDRSRSRDAASLGSDADGADADSGDGDDGAADEWSRWFASTGPRAD